MKDQRNRIVRRPKSKLGVYFQSQLDRFRMNRPAICGFFASGRTCSAGDECPFSHSFPRNSHTGLNDPNPDPGTVDLLFKMVYMGPLDPPRDQTVKTLFIRLLNSNVHEEHLRDRFSPYGEIESIVYFGMRGVSCAFLTYTTRQAAEKAMLEHSPWVDVNGQMLKLLWGTHRIPKDAELVGGSNVVKNDGGGFAWVKETKDVVELPYWCKRGYGSSEQLGGWGFDGRRGWDAGIGGSNWAKVNAVGGFGECLNWGRANDGISSSGKDNYSSGGSNWGQQDGCGFAWGSQNNNYGGGGPSWSSLGDAGRTGGWETNTGDDDDDAWGCKPNAVASSSSGDQ
ncbi:hypothetical protein HID58_089863 [Brassica napus]|uniref:(rape) hypothetical protein n=2 Tax=Brassica napus TaxID=3708 RepID=A0A816JKX1_BRANA|nr:protein RNA-directed DNA methylation 3-like [Brassica napus]XP_048624313.1 protein RNA-directed DNA methylation 3-like [Brassica napus]KAH0861601.1 hypothetical protein HID58_089862 [Brassica napus]KAH0861602.1 hypothetical protein HID58_089863 [Brassica napus]CAF1791402.1 unnamed protein product [Brassica napus]